MVAAGLGVIYYIRSWQKTAPSALLVTDAMAVMCWAVIMRVVAAFTPAFFEDDYYRYLWDGYRTLVDGNAYLLAPSAFFGTAIPSEVMAEVLSQVNYPHIPTIYGPLLQNLFALSASVTLGALWPWKLFIGGVDILLIYFLIRHFGANRAMLYAFSPLVVHEVVVAAHADGLIGALLFVAWVIAKRAQSGRLILSAICIGSAIAIKIHAIFALPFLLIMLDCRDKNIAARCKSALIFIGAVAFVYGLYWMPYASGFSNAWQSFFTFARSWQFNALAYAFIDYLIPSVSREVALGLIVSLILSLTKWHWHEATSRALPAMVLAFASLIVLSPVINAWYLLWLLPLACGTNWLTPWVAASVLLLSYASGFNLGDKGVAPHNLPCWVTLIEVSALVIAGLFDYRQTRRRVLCAAGQ
jgi:alpha-1,6-mannosyltransferase